ncbi:cuticle protein-like isoform X2 [Episyrphus balteatus]|uniref:cuticle protein-like isoform X2 n=1 Tax=Episyrphus balteatus TaxID=286459 RepID=UPI00248599F6|nr:cuticle protein-like isoform X2 [Episyrphus balteatus]XP_055856313.1 cuticle protein-like isoform X2 [Episyrphus balteatus]
MAFKFVLAFALVAVASAGYVPQPQVYHAAPVAHTVAVAQAPQHILTKSVEEYDPHPQYNVAYNVHDSITGDVKSQSESRDGDVVNGEYSLIDADGYKRTVSYSADAEHGFNAVVNRVPIHEGEHAAHAPAQAVVKHLSPVHAAPSHTYAAPAVVKTVAPVSYAAPTYHHAVSGPVSYAAPSYHHTVSAPVVASAPVSYAAPTYHQAVSGPVVSYAAPTHYKSTPVTYSTSNIVKNVSPVTYATAPAAPSHVHQYVSSPTYAAPANYHAHPQTVYVAPSVVKTVSSPSYYKSAPVAYATSESYSAPATYVKSSEHNIQYHH